MKEKKCVKVVLVVDDDARRREDLQLLRLDHSRSRPTRRRTMAAGHHQQDSKTVFKLALPHVCLWSLAGLYCVAGALVFMQLEGQYNLDAVQLITRAINETASRLYYYNNGTSGDDEEEASWKAQGNEELTRFFRRIYQIRKQMAQQSTVTDLDTSGGGSGGDKWAFGRACFFTATTLTSIGYGNQTPSTRPGKFFCIFYVLLGLPLVVITVADIAKFLSHFIVWSYCEYLRAKWRLRLRVRNWRRERSRRRASEQFERERRRRGGGLPPPAGEFCDLTTTTNRSSDEEVAEFLWVNLVNAEFVEIPASLMFTLILGYVALGGWYFRTVEADWTFFEGFYFSLITILAIGFGDYTPRNDRYIYLSLLYVLSGIVLTTTCIDIVGVEYINRLHFWGRKLNKVDPMQWLKDVQARRLRSMKRKAMAALFNTLTALHYMRVEPAFWANARNVLSEEAIDKTAAAGKDDREEGSNQTTTSIQVDDQQISTTAAAGFSPNMDYSNIMMPPSMPQDLRAVHISVHSVTLRWDRPEYGFTDDMYYSLSYRLRTLYDNKARRRDVEEPTTRSSLARSIVEASSLAQGLLAAAVADSDQQESLEERLAPRKMGMTGVDRIPGTSTTFTVNGLKSFAFYQFSLTAVNKNGRSRPVRTQEYTEPSTVPLNIRADAVSDTMAKVIWDPPARNKMGLGRYTLHVTCDSSKPFNEWRRVEASPGEHELHLSHLDPRTTYVICVSANHNRGLATLSRSLTFATAASPDGEREDGKKGDEEEKVQQKEQRF